MRKPTRNAALLLRMRSSDLKHGDRELWKVLNSDYISTNLRRLVDISTLILFSSMRYVLDRYIRRQRWAFLKSICDDLCVYFAWCSTLSVLVAIIHVVISEVFVDPGGTDKITCICFVFRWYWSLCWWCVWTEVCRHRWWRFLYIRCQSQAYINTLRQRSFNLRYINYRIFISVMYILLYFYSLHNFSLRDHDELKSTMFSRQVPWYFWKFLEVPYKYGIW